MVKGKYKQLRCTLLASSAPAFNNLPIFLAIHIFISDAKHGNGPNGHGDEGHASDAEHGNGSNGHDDEGHASEAEHGNGSNGHDGNEGHASDTEAETEHGNGNGSNGHDGNEGEGHASKSTKSATEADAEQGSGSKSSKQLRIGKSQKQEDEAVPVVPPVAETEHGDGEDHIHRRGMLKYVLAA